VLVLLLLYKNSDGLIDWGEQEAEGASRHTDGLAATVMSKMSSLQQQVEELEASWRSEVMMLDNNVEDNLQWLTEEVGQYLIDVRRSFLDTHRRSLKDDKMSKLIKTFLTTF
jgi:hypothetical protein